jgi:tetratricopeptide (TPR) repeat protein
MLVEYPHDNQFLAIANEFNITAEEDSNEVPILMIQFGKTPQYSLSQDFLHMMSSITKALVFIETGTFAGGTTAEAARIFHEVHSIELSKELYEKAQIRFKSIPNIHLYQGDSSDLLIHILTTMKGGPYLLWLDGHYSEGFTAKGKANTPILDEVRAIKGSGLQDVYILIDDLRVFEKHPDIASSNSSLCGYPTIEELYQEILTINSGYQLVILGDIAFAYPQNVQIDISPVVRACTISRRYDENNFPVEEVLAAENIIAAAQGSELHMIQEVLPTFFSAEAHLGGHYMLWKGLTLNAQGKHTEACKHYMMAKTSRINPWRLDWHLSQALNSLGRTEDALLAIRKVLAVQPNFLDGLIFYQNLLKNLNKELFQLNSSEDSDPEVHRA